MRTTPVQERSRRTLRSLLEAANDEFAEFGFHAAQIVRIASRADVSVGSLYRFFPDKEAMATAIAGQYLEAVQERYAPILASITTRDQILDAVAELVRAAADLQLEHAGYYRLTTDIDMSSPKWPATQVRASVASTFTAALDEVGISANSTSADPTTVVLYAVDTVRTRLADLVADDATRQVEVEELVCMIVSYVAARLNIATDS